MRPAGPDGAQLGESDGAVRMDGHDQGVEDPGIAAGLRGVFGEQPVGDTEYVDGTGQDVAVVVSSG